MNRFLSRRFIVALIVVLIAYWLFYLSYFQENSEAYLFPSIITVCVLFFSITSLFRETWGMCVDDFKAIPVVRLLPAIIGMVVTVLSVEHLGMYTTCAIALFLISTWYSPVENTQKRILNSLLLSLGFIVFMYLLFSVMLGVQMPRGLLI